MVCNILIEEAPFTVGCFVRMGNRIFWLLRRNLDNVDYPMWRVQECNKDGIPLISSPILLGEELLVPALGSLYKQPF